MIGDALIWIRTWIHQNLCCAHKYEDRGTEFRVFSWRECYRCGRTKDWNQNL